MTINEIARLAGVSRATVSRYLNEGYVSQEKKEKIRAVIEQTGYQPSSYAQTLRSRKTKCVGVIIPKIDSASIARMVKGISETLSAEDYRLLLACTNNDEKEELKYLNLFRENLVDGIILMGTIFTPEHKRLIRELSVPIVILGQALPECSCVYHDEYEAGIAITRLLMPSSRTWGYIGVTQKDESVGRIRRNGVFHGLSLFGVTLSDEQIAISDFTMESGYEAASRLFSSCPSIDTLLCATDTIAAGARNYLIEQGYRIPEDVQLAGFGDSSISQVTTPTLTTVHFHYKTSGIEAARLLLDMMKESGSAMRKELKLGFHLVENHSYRKEKDVSKNQ